VAKRQIGDSYYQLPNSRLSTINNQQTGLDLFDYTDSEFPTFKEFKTAMEIQYLQRVIVSTNGELPEILRFSGLSKSHYYSLLKKYDIKS
jgi:two-component system NtrC family response regulator